MYKRNVLLIITTVILMLTSCVAKGLHLSSKENNPNSVTKEIHLSPKGNDTNSGTKNNPYLTFEKALEQVKEYAGKETVTVWFHPGEYYLKETIVLGNEYSGTTEHPVLFSALPGAKVIIKGSQKLESLDWTPYKNGIYQAQVPSGLSMDQLFVDEERQVRARFPNYDYENPLRDGKGYHQVTGGTNHRYDKWFSYNPKTFSDKKWAHPETGIVHAFQSHNWGNLQYKIKAVNKEKNRIILDEGGWQMQRTHGIGGKGKKLPGILLKIFLKNWMFPGNGF